MVKRIFVICSVKLYIWFIFLFVGEKLFKCEFDGCDCRFVNSLDRKKYFYVYMSDKLYNCWVWGCEKSYMYLSFFWKYMKIYGDVFLMMEC